MKAQSSKKVSHDTNTLELRPEWIVKTSISGIRMDKTNQNSSVANKAN
ncbi:MAG: hypothetical protein ACRBBN_16785 [Methyloligellaceae bacterium]